MEKKTNLKEIIEYILEKLNKSNYIDPAEHLYDAIKGISRHLNDDNLNDYIHDFLWGLESDTVIDIDGIVKECSDLLRKFYVMKTTKNKQPSKVERSEIYYKILAIIKKLKLVETDSDDYDHPSIACELEKLFISEKNLNNFESFKDHMLSARATLYPDKTYEEVVALLDTMKNPFN